MVAYSFQKPFHDPIRRLEKLHTVRADRPRHARVGEDIQLYGGMRTKYCKKLLTPDPVCTEVIPILIRFAWDTPEMISAIEIGPRKLTESQIEDFAAADGFAINYPDGTARSRMGHFWHKTHGRDDFFGLLIRWEPR